MTFRDKLIKALEDTDATFAAAGETASVVDLADAVIRLLENSRNEIAGVVGSFGIKGGPIADTLIKAFAIGSFGIKGGPIADTLIKAFARDDDADPAFTAIIERALTDDGGDA